MQAGVTIRIADQMYEISLTELKRLSGEELITYVKAGHQDAFAILFERYHRLVLEIALKVLRNRAEAEDLAQSVFFEIFQVAAQYDPERGSIKTWIAQYAYHRSLSRRRYLNVRAAFSEQELNDSVERELAATPRSIESFSEQETKRLVEQGLCMLNQPQRETLMLAFFEGLSMTEMARRRRESVANVRHHYYRGLKKLRTLLYGSSEKEPAEGSGEQN
jgi:RNA polymerase sigma-70 factor (ECF subfamily)